MTKQTRLVLCRVFRTNTGCPPTVYPHSNSRRLSFENEMPFTKRGLHRYSMCVQTFWGPPDSGSPGSAHHAMPSTQIPPCDMHACTSSRVRERENETRSKAHEWWVTARRQEEGPQTHPPPTSRVGRSSPQHPNKHSWQVLGRKEGSKAVWSLNNASGDRDRNCSGHREAAHNHHRREATGSRGWA